MEGAVISGAALSALDKLLQTTPESAYESETKNIHHVLDKNEQHKTITNHYKVIKTQTYDVRHSVHADDEIEKNDKVTDKKKKKWHCFGKCFGGG